MVRRPRPASGPRARPPGRGHRARGRGVITLGAASPLPAAAAHRADDHGGPHRPQGQGLLHVQERVGVRRGGRGRWPRPWPPWARAVLGRPPARPAPAAASRGPWPRRCSGSPTPRCPAGDQLPPGPPSRRQNRDRRRAELVGDCTVHRGCQRTSTESRSPSRRAGGSSRSATPTRCSFAEAGRTKLDLARYYQAVEPALMAAMGGRPVLLQRFPHGAGGPSFFQKRVPEKRPDWLETTIVSTPNGTTSQALVAADLAHVLWAVNLACLGFHVWPYRADDPEHADELRIDLDPDAGSRLRDGPGGGPRGRRPAPWHGAHGLAEDDRQPGHPRLRPPAARDGRRSRCGRRPWRWPGSWSGAGPI